MSRILILALHIAIGVTFVVCLFAQIVVIPGAVAGEARLEPLVAYFRIPFTVIGILCLGCFQVVLLGVAMLLSKAWGDEIFSPRAFRWLDVITGAVLAASVLSFIVFVMQLTLPGTVDPQRMTSLGLMLAGFAGTGLGVSAVLVLLVVRGLLRKATSFKDELAQVV